MAVFTTMILSCQFAFAENASCLYDADMDSKKTADHIGRGIIEAYLNVPIDYYSMQSPSKCVTYQETCLWLGAIAFAEAKGDSVLLRKLANRYEELVLKHQELLPPMDHVDSNVFGSIPLELYVKGLCGKDALKLGLKYADSQWMAPDDASTKARDMAAKGFSWETRLWVDDMFMITTIQVQAYKATGKKKYIDRAALEMVLYLDNLQQSNGLFYHNVSAPFYWGRGNGWAAVGMAELLSQLPKSSKYYSRIMAQYKLMMNALKTYQSKSGLWRQLIDDDEAWYETSGSAMFVVAMKIGLKNGWLDKSNFEHVVDSGWNSLVKHLTDDYKMKDVCQGTNVGNSRSYYLMRKRITGNLHGQATMLWCAATF